MPENKVTALVTGASAGLGAEFCGQLAARCDVIIAVGRSGGPLDELSRTLPGQARLHPVVADLATVEGVARCLEALRQLGPVNILVNCPEEAPRGRFDKQDIAVHLAEVRARLEAVLCLCRGAVPFMRENGGGQIVNLVSAGAFRPDSSRAVTDASAAFLVSFSRSLQQEVAQAGIQVQCLCHRPDGGDGDSLVGAGDSIPTAAAAGPEAVVAASIGAFGGAMLVVPGPVERELLRVGIRELLDSIE